MDTPIPAGHLRDNRAALQGPLDRSRFLAVRPAPAASAPARYHLNTASRRGVRVKRLVKSRHKSISKSGDHTHRTIVRPKGAAATSLTLHPSLATQGRRRDRHGDIAAPCSPGGS